MTARKVFLIPDLQIPLQDKGFVEAMALCIDGHKQGADEVVTIGDELDFTSCGRWSEGTPLAYTKALGRERDEWVQVAADLQVDHVIRSNHTDRLFATIMRKAPGLLGVPEFEIQNFMRLPELGITWHETGYEYAPGWIALHGDESGLSQVAGTTAAKLAAKVGLSVTCGHTHRLGMQPVTQSIHGRLTRTLWGIEVGHAMDLKKATYTKHHNWQQGWVVMHIDGKHVYPEVIPVVGKSFVYHGERFSWK